MYLDNFQTTTVAYPQNKFSDVRTVFYVLNSQLYNTALQNIVFVIIK